MRLLLVVLLAFLPALSQDTRKVTEPVIPPPCTLLRAMLNRVGASIYAGDEGKPDTARIQDAIDHCPAGQAVVLQRAAYRTDAFLSGPLQLRKGVVLGGRSRRLPVCLAQSARLRPHSRSLRHHHYLL